jgi:hypothetical protein
METGSHYSVSACNPQKEAPGGWSAANHGVEAYYGVGRIFINISTCVLCVSLTMTGIRSTQNPFPVPPFPYPSV